MKPESPATVSSHATFSYMNTPLEVEENKIRKILCKPWLTALQVPDVDLAVKGTTNPKVGGRRTPSSIQT